jgi:hypothetical protein
MSMTRGSLGCLFSSTQRGDSLRFALWNIGCSCYSLQRTAVHRFLTLLFLLPRNGLPDDFKTIPSSNSAKVVHSKKFAKLTSVAFPLHTIEIVLGDNFKDGFIYHGYLLLPTNTAAARSVDPTYVRVRPVATGNYTLARTDQSSR